MVNPPTSLSEVDVQAAMFRADARLTRVEEDLKALSGLPEAVANLTTAVAALSGLPAAVAHVSVAVAECLVDLRDFRHQTAENFKAVDAHMDKMDARVDKMDVRMDKMDARMDRMDARFDGIDGRLDRMEGLLVKIADKLEVARPSDPSMN